MTRSKNFLYIAIAVAALLWFFMFSPWTGHILNFWVAMSCSAVILTTLSVSSLGNPFKGISKASAKEILIQVVLGVVIAFVLWGIFWIGDKLSSIMFGFARGQVDTIYGMKDGSSPVLIATLLLVLIGPAEEFFWRGFVQKSMAERMHPTTAMFVTAIVYALVHIWSFNFMLVMAALVAGGVWGLLYRIKPSLLPALIISHALWDALVFVILPI